jgi:hypothetical protein
MPSKRLGVDEEAALAKEAENAKVDEQWEMERPRRVRRGSEPTAVLSVRVPLSQLRKIRETLARERIPLSELLQQAVAMAAGTGTRISVENATVTVYASTVARSETVATPTDSNWTLTAV